MPTTAKVICDSINPDGDRLTTMVLEYPRYILAEFNTHRMFSRCTASSRAIPVAKRIEMIMNDPVVPHWGVNKPGMQADEDAVLETAHAATQIWLDTMLSVVDSAKALADLGIHKQAVNRLLEPFVHVKTIVSATEWANFFALRCHPAAAPEMRALADAMQEAYRASVPYLIEWGKWHLPFITPADHYASRKDGCCGNRSVSAILVGASVARCARVSYNNHDGTEPVLEKDIELYDKLVGSYPRHASATEHAARSCNQKHDHGNIKGWHQHRKDIPDENITIYPDPRLSEVDSPL